VTHDASPADTTGAALARLALFALALGALFAAGLLLAPHSPRRLRADLAGLDPWLPVAAMAAYPLAVCALVPGPVLAGASGLLYGAALGTLVAIVSATLGASLAFLIARAGARRPYSALAVGRTQSWTNRIERRGFLAVMYARPVPGAPFALVSYAAGITRIRLYVFAGATAIAAAPRAFAYAALGGSPRNYTSPQTLAAIAVLAIMTIGGATILWRARPRSTHRTQANRLVCETHPPQASDRSGADGS
jgi:uncharacterized membrane protein YdjX (TVP38/TMEM64 family)